MLKKWLVAGLLCVGMSMPVLAESVTLIPRSSQWSYFKGTQEPSSPSSLWRELSFNDSTWLTGKTPLYFGGNISSGTVLSDMRYRYSTVYLRKKFSLKSGTYEKLSLNALCDDGFIVWVNGEEVARFNAGAGEQPYNAVSTAIVSRASWQTFDLSKYNNVLKAGEENVITIHALNCSLTTSGDFAIDAELTAEQTNDLTPPTVISVSPIADSVISDPPSVIIFFSEPVSGVTADSLLCDGKPAASYSELSSSQYLFKFDKKEQDGQVTVSWNSNAKIYDKSPNKNPFEIPSTQWSYTVDTQLPDSDIVINEFLASNSSGLKTKSGDRMDWVELYNKGTATADISGWYLTDSENDLTQWQFPAGTFIPAGGYLIVFCDNNAKDPLVNGEYFADFSLSKDGEYLALVKNDESIAYEISPAYPQQYSDISYGQGMYYPEPTPGKANGAGYQEPVGEVTFSEPRGYRPAPFELTMETTTEGASIYYTTDGTVPTKSSTRYTKPLSISKITYIRAIALKDGHIASPVTTRTWLFLDEVLSQPSTTPAGWPASYAVNSHRMVYGMDQSVVNSKAYGEGVREGMLSIGTISMVTDLKNLFDSSIGIYVNPSGDGIAWERPASLELIDPNGGDEFQIEAGIRIRGGFSRSSANPKHSFRFFFRSEYGGKLKFPLFGDEGASEFDKVDLRTSQNYAWSYLAGNPPSYNTFIRETFPRDSQRDCGMPYTRSRYYHLFINGQYWGLYQTQERSEADYAETYLGGDNSDWDCIKSGADAADGNADAFTKLYQISVNQGFAGRYATNYTRIKGQNPDGTPNPDLPQYLDEDNLIQFVLNNFYTADVDSPINLGGGAPNNLYGLYNRVNPSGFSWYRHDAEHSMGAKREYGASYDITSRGWDLNSLSTFTPIRLHQKLMDHPDYKMRFVDLFQQTYLAPNGAMSTRSNLFRWNQRQEEVDKAMYAESARWTWDVDRTYGKMNHDIWLEECNWVKNNFIIPRTGYLLTHLKNRGWYPKVEMPTFSKESGEISPNTQIYVVGGGTVYYTTDGSDPRLAGGSVSKSAQQLEPMTSEEQILIDKKSAWEYYDAGTTPPREGTVYWYQPTHTHQGWKQGNGRFGFGVKGVDTEVARYKANGTDQVITTYFVKKFKVLSAMTIPELILDLNCDDGAIVYINGYRAFDYNMPSGYLTADTLASTDISGSTENEYISWQIDSKYLVNGENTLAIEIHQSSATSDDNYFDLQLRAAGGSVGGASEGIVVVSPGTIIKARSLDSNGDWSAIAIADFTQYSNEEDLKVTEMMYSAQLPDGAAEQGLSRDDFAWIEIQNTGNGVLNLEGYSFLTGIDYTFPQLRLESGEYVVLAKNLAAFSSVYDTNGIILLSGYSGNLARKGELITLKSPSGNEVLSYTYSNKWYPETDRGGYSLVVQDVNAENQLWSTAENWKVSSLAGGSPGTDDGGVVEAPTIGRITPGENGALTVEAGERLVLNVTATGSNPLRYQWYKDGLPISGATGSSYEIANVTVAHQGVYTVSVANRAGTAESDALNLTVNFILQLQDISIGGDSVVVEGKAATYTCTASYNDGSSKLVNPQWSAEPEKYATIDQNGLLTALAEGSVSITASYAEDGISKSITKLVKIDSSLVAPEIVTQPVEQTVRQGDSVSFSVTATGSEVLSYQWKKNGVNIKGATSSTYTINNVTISDAANYSVTVTNAKGSVTSKTAALKVVNAGGSQLILDFQFNEGSGKTSTDTVNGIIADLGDAGEAKEGMISSDSPSGINGDHSVLIQSGNWLSGWFENEPLGLESAFTWEGWIWMENEANEPRDFFRLGNTLKFGLNYNGFFEATFLGIKDVDSSIKLEVGTWTHLACTWTPGVGFDFYKNGAFIETVPTPSYPKNYVDNNLFVGAANSGGYCLFNGKLDRIRLHKGILKVEDLDADASHPRNEMNAAVLAYEFNESVLPFASSGTVSVSLYNAAGEEIPTNNVVNWSTSTPARDELWTGSESDYSIYLNNPSRGEKTTQQIVFDTADLDFGDQSDPSFSIEAWIKGVQRSSNKQVFFQSQGSPSGKAPRIAFAISADMTVYITTLAILDIDTQVPIPEDGKWHHIACAYSHTEGIIYVYVDGELKKEHPYNGGVNFRANTDKISGCIGSETSGWYCYSGYVDRIRLHKGVLLASELDYVDYSQKITAPEISVPPMGQSVKEGDSVTFGVTVSGTEPFNYQWYKDGSAINGAVDSTYTIQSAQLSDAGAYSVRVSNGAGSVTSESAELKVESLVKTYKVIADDASRMYGTANPAFSYRILDSEGNDVTASIDGKAKLSTTALLGSPAGTYPISVARGSLPKENVYEFVAGTLTVTKVVPVIVWNTPEPVVAGTVLSEVQLNATANVAGSFVYDPAAGTVLAEGVQILKTTFVPSDSTNYEIVEKTVELEVMAPVITEPTLTFFWENGVLILNFTGVLYESEDLENWILVPDAHEVYKVEPTTGKRQKYYRSSNY